MGRENIGCDKCPWTRTFTGVPEPLVMHASTGSRQSWRQNIVLLSPLVHIALIYAPAHHRFTSSTLTVQTVDRTCFEYLAWPVVVLGASSHA
ncbi:hypothetical protein BaRGS_00024092 [Batillaria attramentaria]|uniref:Uncharacterized protein n=1 Tax=Batillaria attramentaria TaxID=370345 RepID=A0ABD0KC32_9CAEN